ncbi:MAG TPA: hypothetical protein VK997_06180 [Deferrisomatales bacterium]|nr:hypothetical protein [Deferrisomatales bacterium]
MLSVICAWCGTSLGAKPGGEGVSHGICPPCARRHLFPFIEALKHGGRPSAAEETTT